MINAESSSNGIEDFRPRLKTGTIKRERDRVVFTLEHPYRTVILPADAMMYLGLLDGRNSITEILHKIWDEHGKVHFKTIVTILERLQKFDCLENADSIPRGTEHWEEQLTTRIHGLTRPFLKIPLFEKMSMGKSMTAFFYAIAAGIIGDVAWFAAARHGTVFGPQFLLVKNSYWIGLLLFWVSASALISFQNIVKTALLLLQTGNVTGGSLQLNFFSFSYRVDDEPNLMGLTKLQAAVYTLAAVAAPFFLVATVQAVQWSFAADVLPIALLFTLVDTDPYLSSEVTRLFKRFYSAQSLYELIPYLRKKSLNAIFDRESQINNEILFTCFSTLAIVWTYLALSLCSSALNKTLSHLAAVIWTGTVLEKIPALLILAGFTLVNFYLIFDLLALLTGNIIQPFRRRLHHAKGRTRGRDVAVETAELKQTFANITLFNELNDSFLDALASKTRVRSIPAGTHVIVQGSSTREMYVLMEGEVEIVRHEATGYNRKITELAAPTVFGETAMLEDVPRTADVIAKSAVKVAVLQRSHVMDLVHDDKKKLLAKIMLQQYLASSSLFSDLPREAVRVFMNAGHFKELPAGHTLFHQGEQGDSFYLLVRGSVDVIIGNRRVQSIGEGGFFGEIALLTNSPRNATIRTTEPTVVFRIDRPAFWKIIFGNMNLALCIESVAEQRRLQDEQEAAGK